VYTSLSQGLGANAVEVSLQQKTHSVMSRAAIVATVPTFRGTRHGIHVSVKWIVFDCFAILLLQQHCQRNSRLWVDDASSVFLRCIVANNKNKTNYRSKQVRVMSCYEMRNFQYARYTICYCIMSLQTAAESCWHCSMERVDEVSLKALDMPPSMADNSRHSIGAPDDQ